MSKQRKKKKGRGSRLRVSRMRESGEEQGRLKMRSCANHLAAFAAAAEGLGCCLRPVVAAAAVAASASAASLESGQHCTAADTAAAGIEVAAAAACSCSSLAFSDVLPLMG